LKRFAYIRPPHGARRERELSIPVTGSRKNRGIQGISDYENYTKCDESN